MATAEDRVELAAQQHGMRGAMRKLEVDKAASRVEDASIVREVRRVPRLARFTLVAVVIAVFVASLWPAYLKYVKPRLEQRTLDATLLTYSQEGEDRRQAVKKLKALPREQMLLGAHKGLLDHAELDAARAALDLAINEGSAEAGLTLGKALRDGVFGEKDNAAALQQFERVRRNIDAGVRVGDPIALYAHAVMLSEGLGVEVDRRGATAAMRRAADGLAGSRLERVAREAARGDGAFEGDQDSGLASKLASRLMTTDVSSAYSIGLLSCDRSGAYSPKDELVAESKEDRRRRRGLERACQASWHERGAIAGHPAAMSRYAEHLLYEEGDLQGAAKWYAAAGGARTDNDNYFYGLVQSVAARDAEAVLSGVKLSHAAQLADSRSAYPTVGTSEADVSIALWTFERRAVNGADKSDERFKLAVALLAQGELAGTLDETIKALRSGREIAQVLTSVPVRRAASRIAEAIRSNRLLSEVQASDADRAQAPSSRRPVAKGAAPDVQSDPEQQARSGYLPKAPRLATDGLSTFTVDNTGGQHDVVVRLYLGSSMPAVRGFYVKRGESFRAQSLRAGTYAMRYRHIGSEDTYEAEKTWELTEREIEGGRRYSTVTVRLSRGPDGNLTTKKVPPEAF